jgi:hypothetical protein
MNEGTQQEPTTGWHYHPDSGNASTASPAPAGAPATAKHSEVEWTASEFIAHHKSVGWYAALFVITVAAGTGMYLLTQDVITTAVIGTCGLVFGVAAARKPRVLGYRLDEAGLTIGNKFFPYHNYKAFALVEEGHFTSISFVPLKRFMPAISVYFDPEDEAKILDVLSEHLPLQPGSTSAFDGFIRRIRF